MPISMDDVCVHLNLLFIFRHGLGNWNTIWLVYIICFDSHDTVSRDCSRNLLISWRFCDDQVIRNHPSALQMYESRLLELGHITKEDIDSIHNKVSSILNEEFNNSKDYIPNRRDWLSAYWAGFKSPEQISRIRNTGYAVKLSLSSFVSVISRRDLSVTHCACLQC